MNEHPTHSEEEVLTFKEALLQSPEGQEYVKKQEVKREKNLIRLIRKKLRWYDVPLFFFYRKLADYFAGGQRVIILPPQRGDYSNTKYGAKVYGEDCWIHEKEEYAEE
jgi:hypothetical protein